MDIKIDSAWKLRDIDKIFEMLPPDAPLLINGSGEYTIDLCYTEDECYINLVERSKDNG